MEISELIGNKFTITSTSIPVRADMPEHKAFHYLVTLAYEGRQTVFNYSMGYGHAHFDSRSLRRAETFGSFSMKQWNRLDAEQKIKYAKMHGIGVIVPVPTLKDVLECIVDDVMGYEMARDFESWASEYGYDSDSRTAERVYNAIAEQSKQFRQLVGGEQYRALINDE